MRIKDIVQLLTGVIGYWNVLLKSATFGGNKLRDCLQVILTDVIAIWNFTITDKDKVHSFPVHRLRKLIISVECLVALDR